MRGPKAHPIQLTHRQRAVLEQIVRRATSPQREVLRAKMLLAMADGENNEQVARRLGLRRKTVRMWRARWLAAAERLAAAETEVEDKELSGMIREALDDEPRSGRPATYTAEQICQIVAVACEETEAAGRPVTHWTPRELADEVVRRGIVGGISVRSVGRFLKSGRSETPSIAVLADVASGRPTRFRRRSRASM